MFGFGIISECAKAEEFTILDGVMLIGTFLTDRMWEEA